MAADPRDDQEPTSWDRAMAEHAARLKPGVRVRVRLGECPRMVSWHGTIEDGATGTVFGAEGVKGAPADHPYFVWFDDPLRTRRAWNYNAAELVPLDPDDAQGKETS